MPQTKNTEEGGFGGVFASKAAVALLAATARRLASGFYHWRSAIPCLRASFAGNDVGSGYALVVGVLGFVSALLRRTVGAARRAAGTKGSGAGPRAGGRFIGCGAAPGPRAAGAVLWYCDRAARGGVSGRGVLIGPTTALPAAGRAGGEPGRGSGLLHGPDPRRGLAPLAVGRRPSPPPDGGLGAPCRPAAAVAAAAVSSSLFLVAAGLLDGEAGKESCVASLCVFLKAGAGSPQIFCGLASRARGKKEANNDDPTTTTRVALSKVACRPLSERVRPRHLFLLEAARRRRCFVHWLASRCTR